MSSQTSENDSASPNPSGAAASVYPYNYPYSSPVASSPFAHLTADSQQAAAQSLRSFLCSSGVGGANSEYDGVSTSDDAGTGLCGAVTSSSSTSSPSTYAHSSTPLSSICSPPPGIGGNARCSIEQLTEKGEKPDASAPGDDGSNGLESGASIGVSEHVKAQAVSSSSSSPSCLSPSSPNNITVTADGTDGSVPHPTKADGDSCQQQVPSCEGGPNGALGDNFRVLSRKRKADAFLPDGDAETMERLKRLMESLTREQMKLLLAKACVQYPGMTPDYFVPVTFCSLPRLIYKCARNGLSIGHVCCAIGSAFSLLIHFFFHSGFTERSIQTLQKWLDTCLVFVWGTAMFGAGL